MADERVNYGNQITSPILSTLATRLKLIYSVKFSTINHLSLTNRCCHSV